MQVDGPYTAYGNPNSILVSNDTEDSDLGFELDSELDELIHAGLCLDDLWSTTANSSDAQEDTLSHLVVSPLLSDTSSLASCSTTSPTSSESSFDTSSSDTSSRLSPFSVSSSLPNNASPFDFDFFAQGFNALGPPPHSLDPSDFGFHGAWALNIEDLFGHCAEEKSGNTLDSEWNCVQDLTETVSGFNVGAGVHSTGNLIRDCLRLAIDVATTDDCGTDVNTAPVEDPQPAAAEAEAPIADGCGVDTDAEPIVEPQPLLTPATQLTRGDASEAVAQDVEMHVCNAYPIAVAPVDPQPLPDTPLCTFRQTNDCLGDVELHDCIEARRAAAIAALDRLIAPTLLRLTGQPELRHLGDHPGKKHDCEKDANSESVVNPEPLLAPETRLAAQQASQRLEAIAQDEDGESEKEDSFPEPVYTRPRTKRARKTTSAARPSKRKQAAPASEVSRLLESVTDETDSDEEMYGVGRGEDRRITYKDLAAEEHELTLPDVASTYYPPPSVCPSCIRGFKRMGDIYRHLKTYHRKYDDEDVKCKRCSTEFSRPDACKRHSRTCKKKKRKTRLRSWEVAALKMEREERET